MVKYSVENLKNELRKRGQPVSGKKAILLKRLKAALEKKLPVLNNGNVQKRKGPPANEASSKMRDGKESGLATFDEKCFWRVLDPEDTEVDEPDNPTFRIPRAPTIDEGSAEHVPVKHNFSIHFDRPAFTGTVNIPLQYSNGTLKKNKNGTVKTEKVVRKKGTMDPKFKKNHKLTSLSSPEEFFNAVLPLKNNMHNGKEYLSFDLLTKWTNTKAILAGAGLGTCYPEFTPFTINEIRQHIGLYVLYGLSPCPRIEQKFKSQFEDKVHGSDFVFSSFKGNAERRHRHFKAFFAVQNPVIDVPPKSQFPNWKIRPLLMWMNFLFPLIWLLGVAFSIDEMTMGFQGRHADKKRITYKRAGDGFQADALCDDGFTYQIFMRNDPAPKEYTSKGLSPLHSRVMALFDTVKDDHHQCAMDNLYNSVAFCKAAVNHSKKVLCHGVTRKGMRGIPNCVKQEEGKNKKEQLEKRGTVKAAVLEGDSKCQNLVASSVYDTKPVHYLSMVAEELKWVEVSKPVYNVDTGGMEKLKFLRMNQIDNYNNTMGNVDIADQLRGTYDFKHWLRNRKWWWSIWNWGLGVLITNSYIMYVKVNEEEGVQKKNMLSHHDYRRAIAVYLINPEEYEAEKNGIAAHLHPTVSRRAKKSTSDSTTSTLTEETITNCKKEVKTRSARITDDALLPTGSLSRRLNPDLQHFPVQPVNTKARCNLHRWAGVETQKGIMLCPSCNVHLCIECYKIFHTDHNLGHKKNQLKNKYSKK
jgi:hypothetical protein